MGAPDFFFAVNAMFRHLHDRYGKAALVRYWRELGRQYYRPRWERWQRYGADEIARDWDEYFSREPQADVQIAASADVATLNIAVCPAIKHLRDQKRDIVPSMWPITLRTGYIDAAVV